MNIILQNYNDLLKKMIYDVFSSNLKEQLNKIDSNGNVMNYVNLLSNLDESFKYISRQTVRNIIMSSKISNIKSETLDTPDSLYIIADEKWIHTQNNNNNDVMEKSVVLFEGINKHKLKNKMIFASLDFSFLNNCLDYIYNTYDTDKIKNIYLMGDGASWIKNLRNDFLFL